MSSKLAIRGGTPVLTAEDHRTWPQVEAEEKDAVMAVLERGILSGGDAPEARAFEEAFADFVGTKHALLTHAGTSALQI
ncbi:MAG TPA: aminotransferase DegT, partial [Myxococcales bacterium]|nr:aminotransferase DegT [Myxococcales bacterium]